MWRRVWRVLAASCVLAALSLAAAAGQSASPAENAPSLDGDYTLGPGDVLGISVYGLPQLDQTVTVSGAGRIRLARVGTLAVSDMTVPQVQKAVAEALTSKGLLHEPWVQVAIKKHRARPVFVLGEVIQPGEYIMRGPMFVLDLIGKAQGLSAEVDPIAYLYRVEEVVPKDQGAPSVDATDVLRKAVELDILALISGERPDLNLELRPGDVLYVRKYLPEKYFVLGEVASAGEFEFPKGQPVRLSSAIARAGGPLRTAKPSKGLVVRSDEGGASERLTFDFHKILTGAAPDVLLAPGDIVFIPGSRVKTLGAAFVPVLHGMATSSTQRVIR